MKGYRGWITKKAFAGDDFHAMHRRLEGSQARFLYERAELYQKGMLQVGGQDGYTGDHLHSWSRPYEYSYIAANLPDSGGTVLDMGSGFSYFPYYVEGQGHEVTCSDITALGPAFEQTGVRFVQDDITNTRLTPGFDAIYSVSVLEHIGDKVAAVKALFELLKPGGRLLLTMDCDLGRTMSDTTPCYEEICHLIGLLDHVFECPMEMADFRRGDDLLTTRDFEGPSRWRVPWQTTPTSYSAGFKLLVDMLLRPTVYPATMPTLAVFVGVWDKRA